MPPGKHKGPKLREPDMRVYRKALAGKKQVVIAAEEGMDQGTVSRKIAKVEAILGPEWVQAQRDKLTRLADKALGGIERHLDKQLPNPQVLGDFMKGTTIYRNEITGDLNLQGLTDAELADRAKRILGDVGPTKG